jgi:hypothetical protein
MRTPQRLGVWSLPGSKSVARTDRGTQGLGRPRPASVTRTSALERKRGRVRPSWESDCSILLGDGKADHMGKGATRMRTPHRKHGTDMQGRNTMQTSLRAIAKRARRKSRGNGSAKRAPVKSPVRENCTPGSVGGHPGDRVSYPDIQSKAEGVRTCFVTSSLAAMRNAPVSTQSRAASDFFL